MAKTLCPSCGHSPIPAGADECPVCHEPFAFLQTHKKAKNRFVDVTDREEHESTVFGGALTGEVSAHPYPAAVALFAGAAIWFLRVSGFVVGFHEPQWVFALVALDLLLALVLILNFGPAKLIAQVGMLGQLGVALFLGRDELSNPVQLLFAAHAAAVLFLIVGEPGAVRRSVGVVAALIVAGGAIALMLVVPGSGALDGPRQELFAPNAGFRLLLPSGWVRASSAELAAHLRTPAASGGSSSVGFSSAADRAIGIVVVKRNPDLQLIGGCQALLQDLGGTNVPKPMPHKVPAALGQSAVVYELRTFSGASGLLSCGKRDDGRFVGLAVLSVNPDAAAGARAFDAVGPGLSMQ